MEGVGYMKTVRQLSEQLGIAKQSVDYHVKKLNESYIKEGNVNMIDDRLEQLIIDRVNNNRQQTTQQATDEQQQASDNAEDTNKNTTTESNNVVEILQSHIEEQRNTIRDLSRILDQQQQLTQSSNKKVSKLENKLEEYKYKLEDSNSVAVSTDTKRVLKVKNRKKVNSNNVDDTYTYEDAHTRPTDESDTNEDVEDTKESTNEPIDVSDQTDTNIEDKRTKWQRFKDSFRGK